MAELPNKLVAGFEPNKLVAGVTVAGAAGVDVAAAAGWVSGLVSSALAAVDGAVAAGCVAVLVAGLFSAVPRSGIVGFCGVDVAPKLNENPLPEAAAPPNAEVDDGKLPNKLFGCSVCLGFSCVSLASG